MVDRIDEHRYAKDVGEQDVLLTPVVADLSGLGQEADCREPLFVSRLDFLHGLVQMLDENRHDLTKPRIGFRTHPGIDDLGGTRLIEVRRRGLANG
jgi:hypothetical protein